MGFGEEVNRWRLFVQLFCLLLAGCGQTRSDLHFGVNLGDSNQLVMEKTGVTDFLQKKGSIWRDLVGGAYSKSHLIAVIDLLEEVGETEGIKSLILMKRIDNPVLKTAISNLEKRFPLKYQARYCVRACKERHPELSSYQDMTFVFLDGYLIYGRTEQIEQGDFNINARATEFGSVYADWQPEAPFQQGSAIIQKFSFSRDVKKLLPEGAKMRAVSDLKKSNVVVASTDSKTIKLLQVANLGCTELTSETYNQIFPIMSHGTCLAPFLMKELEKEIRLVAGS